VPTIKRYLSETEHEVPYSVFYNDGRGATKRLREFLGGAYFDFPKDEFVLQKLIEFATDKNSIVLDFFAGSGTTGHAVELQNFQDGGTRSFICVTLDELTPKDSEARKAGLEKVSQITEARLIKVTEISDGARSRGLRVLRLGPSNYEPYFPDESGLFNLQSTSKSKTYSHRTAAAEVLLKQGIELHKPWAGSQQIQSEAVLFLGDNVENFEPISLPAQVMVVVANEDAFEGKDDLKSKIHFDLKQLNKKLVTY
jgi:adenine-specific DNA-methyltransferase